MAPDRHSIGGRQLESWLEANREPLVRRWLELVVERSSLEQLAERPFGDRLRELELLVEAARGAESPAAALENALREALRAQQPFALALLSLPGADSETARALTDAVAAVVGEHERAVAAPDGATAAILPAASGEAARVAADRLRAEAWRRLGGDVPLPDAGIALYPADATTPEDLATAARERLAGGPGAAPRRRFGEPEPEPAEGGPGRRRRFGEPEPEPAEGGPGPRRRFGEPEPAESGPGPRRRFGDASPRPPEDALGRDARWAPAQRPAVDQRGAPDLWEALARRRERRGDDGERPPAPVTPLHPR